MTILEQYSQLALKKVQTNLFLLDEKGLVRFANKSSRDFVGKGGKLTGRHIHDIFHSGENELHSKVDCPLVRGLKTGEPTLRAPDVFSVDEGNHVWVEYSSYPLKDKGKYPAMLFSFVDASVSISSQRDMSEHQAKFKAIFVQAVYPKLILDGTGEVLEANLVAKEIFGNDMENTMIFDYFSPKSEKRFKDFWRRFKKDGQTNERLDLYLNKQLGTKRYVFDVSVSANIQLNTHLLSLINVTKEVIEQEAHNQFIAVASHELKTPLAVIKAYSDLLQRRHKGDEKTGQYLGKIHEKVDVLTRLINAIVDEIKLGAGKLEFVDRQVDFDKFLRRIVEEQQKVYVGNKILIEGKVGSKIKIDPERISQVINNLISNASKYSGRFSPIKIHIVEDEDKVQVGVEDFGKGMSKAEQQKVFSAFFRSPRVVKTNTPGIGLGLFISKQIVEHYKGSMWIKSAWNKGSTFYFTLPKN